jgi:hypothetical protein
VAAFAAVAAVAATMFMMVLTPYQAASISLRLEMEEEFIAMVPHLL